MRLIKNQRLGGFVARPCQVVVADLLEPVADCPSERLDLKQSFRSWLVAAERVSP